MSDFNNYSSIILSIMNTSLIKRAIKIAGNQQKLAEKCNVTQQLVSKWLNGSVKTLSPEAAIRIEKATNKAITRQQLRPDFPWND